MPPTRAIAVTILPCFVLLAMPDLALAVAGGPTFDLQPPCVSQPLDNQFGGPLPDIADLISPGTGTCLTFTVRDPSMRQTEILRVGDTIDFDVVLNNPAGASISRLRYWLSYDPTLLSGESVSILQPFGTPLPGEADFSPSDGFIKLSGSVSNAVKSTAIPFAHVRMKILALGPDGTPILPHDVSGAEDAHSGIFTKLLGVENNLLMSLPTGLFVRLASTASSSLSSSSADVTFGVTSAPLSVADLGTSSSLSSGEQSSRAADASSVFPSLRVSGLKVTTEGSSLFLSWDPLPSAALKGYNIYYGTVSGRYIQRRSVDATARTMTIRALPAGTTYYAAIRAFNDAGEESDFSQEVGVSIGKPQTSTSPLTASVLQDQAPHTPKTGGDVSGETGAPWIFFLFALISAGIGTLLACRRQFIVHPL